MRTYGQRVNAQPTHLRWAFNFPVIPESAKCFFLSTLLCHPGKREVFFSERLSGTHPCSCTKVGMGPGH